MDIEACHELRAEGLNGLDAEVEKEGNLCGGLAFGDQLQDFALARGEVRKRVGLRGSTLEITLHNPFRDRWAEISFPAADRLDGDVEFSGGGVFEQVSGRPGSKCLHDVLIVGMHRKDDDLDTWEVFDHTRGRLEP